jgi:hypothetical protein
MFFNRSGNTTSDQDLRMKIYALERNAEKAHGPGGAAVYFNRAGDLLVNAGRVSTALEYYGEAIDTHVQADRFEPASALCQKVIRLVPSVVRTRCTLTWLALADGFDTDVQHHLSLYIAAATAAGRDDIVLTQLRRMSAVAGAEALRMLLAEQLLMLGDAVGADTLFGAVFRERNRIAPPRSIAPDDRRVAARQAALQGALFNA